MATLKNANCPNCAGDLLVDAHADRVTCRYCGSTSFIAGRGKPPPDARIVHVAMPGGLVAALWIGSAAVLVALIAVIALVSRPEPSVAPPPPRVLPARPVPPPRPPEPPPEVPVVRAESDSPTLLADVDRDGQADVLVPVSVSLAGKTTHHYAFYEGASLRELARTPALEDTRRTAVAALGNRLLIAWHDGQLGAYDLLSGNAQWSTTLGERVVQLRAAKAPEFVHVTTDGARKLLIDLTTGRQSETKEVGGRVLDAAETHRDPRDRNDHAAPEGVEAYHCGGVRVMGSASYSVPDACLTRARIDTDRLPGMVGHRLWKDGAGWLVFGVRSPGASVPMVGKLERGKFVWKSEVPASDPLAAQEGGPRHVALAGGRVIVAHQTGAESRWFVTAFDAAHGERAWTTPLDCEGVHGLLADAGRVFVLAQRELVALAGDDGHVLGRVGER